VDVLWGSALFGGECSAMCNFKAGATVKGKCKPNPFVMSCRVTWPLFWILSMLRMKPLGSEGSFGGTKLSLSLSLSAQPVRHESQSDVAAGPREQTPPDGPKP